MAKYEAKLVAILQRAAAYSVKNIPSQLLCDEMFFVLNVLNQTIIW